MLRKGAEECLIGYRHTIDDVEKFEIYDAQHGIRIVVEDDDEIEVLHSSMDDYREDDILNAI